MHTLCAWSASFFSARKCRHYPINDRGENCADARRINYEVPNDQEGQCNLSFEDQPVFFSEGEVVYEEIVEHSAAHCRDNSEEEAAGQREPRYATPNSVRAPRPIKRK